MRPLRAGAGGTARLRFLLVALSIGVGVAACRTPPVSSLQSTVRLDGAEPITRLLVYSDLGGVAVTHAASREFERGVTERLGTCGVVARFLPVDRMDPTPVERRLEQALAQLETHTVMIVKAMGGELGVDSGRSNQVDAKLELTDVRTRHAMWTAAASAYFSRGDGSATDGAAFATLLVTRLRDDGVLTRCRQDEAYPGCLEDRRRAYEERLNATSARERNAMDPLPRCDVVPGTSR